MMFGAIVAGGTGTRMKTEGKITFNEDLPDIPKQFLPIKNKPLICYSIERFLSVENIDKLFIGVHADFVHYLQSLIDGYFFSRRDDIFVVIGGTDRNSTVMNIIDDIEQRFGKDDDNYIITHDAVRPFVTKEMIEENIALVKKYGAVDTAYNTTDTVVVSDGGEYIDFVPDRNVLYNGQTPQSFNISLLKKYYEMLSNDEKSTLTDACKIISLKGGHVYIAKGDSMNIKITAKADYFIAQAMAEYLL